MNISRYIARWLRFVGVSLNLMIGELDYNGAKKILSQPLNPDDITTDCNDSYLLYFDYDMAKRIILEEDLYWISGLFDNILRFLSRLHKEGKL